MQVREIRLKNFRNIEDLTFRPEARLNFILGENGQGKTAVLEALSYLSTLRSFRGATNDDIIRYQETWGEAACTVGDRPEWSSVLKVTFAEAGERVARTAFIDGKPLRSSTQYLSARFGSIELGFHSIIFNPSDHDLIRGEPGIRRAYLDRAISAEDPEHLKTISHYGKVLQQRNALLKSETRPPAEVLEGFSEPLIEYGARIAHARLEWVIRLQSQLGGTLRKIVPFALPLRAFYLSSWIKKNEGISIPSPQFDPVQFSLQTPLPSLKFFEAEFRDSLAQKRDAEWRAGVTLTGPHRDDFLLTYGDQLLRGHGSQGEIRSALITLKLCEIELFRTKTNHRPILLLDDFSSELDRGRREFLLRYLSETDLQVFVTSTEEPPFHGKIFRMKGGSIESGAV